MADLKLPKLLDRTPAKLSITTTPDLQNALRQHGTGGGSHKVGNGVAT